MYVRVFMGASQFRFCEYGYMYRQPLFGWVAILLLANMGLKAGHGLIKVPHMYSRNSTFSEYGSERGGCLTCQNIPVAVAILLLANMGLKGCELCLCTTHDQVAILLLANMGLKDHEGRPYRDTIRVAILLLANMGLKESPGIVFTPDQLGRNSTFSEYGSERSSEIHWRCIARGRNSTFSEYGSERLAKSMVTKSLCAVAILLLANMGLKGCNTPGSATMYTCRNSTFSEYGSESVAIEPDFTPMYRRNSTFSEYGSERVN